jgi:serine/threonine protein kinase
MTPEAAPDVSAGDSRLAAELLPDLEVVRSLGSGATAEVYLAREPQLQRLVALKLLRRELASDGVVRQRFEREARSAARITHPNVTAIHRIGRLSDGVPYIVMEYIDGRTLRGVLDAAGAFPAAEAQTLLASLAAGLAAAHERGILHRDVRPGNVFIEDRSGRAVLGDFGIAALQETGSASATRLTAAGVRLGDTRYQSPEQLRGETATEQSDVYAFGILAYEVLTGRGPYDARTETQLMAAHLTQKPTPLRELRPDLDPGLAEAYVALGLIHMFFDWDMAGAEQAYRQAIRLQPGYAAAHHELSMLLMRLGRFDEALQEAQHTLYLAPMVAQYQSGLAEIHLFSGRSEQALAAARTALAQDPNWLFAYWISGLAHAQQGRYLEALEALRTGSDRGCSDCRRSLGHLWAVSGRHHEVRELLTTLTAQWTRGGVKHAAFDLASIHMGLGQRERALDWPEQAVEPGRRMLYLRIDPTFLPLHAEPRFQALLKEVRLD